ncbi:SDR family oxidoreductase [Lignipirellula cremea]|uniref:Putative oxidoreductase n=1 Tax=Lignipirellula cremea TaxID=2528010 RepID=A0A518DKQ0_9BACT|nr:SDR family oxidoreductase [Lignipirellula cremea]QDU92413.1 putative oxidoreductase [Lignipirellula cremea]
MNDSNREQLALVTGGASGIGRATAAALAEAGYRVAITGRTEASLQEAATALPGDVCWKTCDVADRSQVTQLFEWLRQEHRSPDILVNSAGVNVAKRMMGNLDPQDFDQVMNVNLTGTFNCIHAALPAMRERRQGVIVNIVSVAGRRAMLLAGAPYCVSKAAQSTLGTYVALEEAPHGVKVTNIYPGETNTPIVDRRPEPPPAEKRAAMLQPEDVAACVMTVLTLPPRAVVPELIVTPPYMMLD